MGGKRAVFPPGWLVAVLALVGALRLGTERGRILRSRRSLASSVLPVRRLATAEYVNPHRDLPSNVALHQPGALLMAGYARIL